jgi:hypothetical protein
MNLRVKNEERESPDILGTLHIYVEVTEICAIARTYCALRLPRLNLTAIFTYLPSSFP